MSEKQKVFISGPISHRLGTYKADFDVAVEAVEAAGFIPLNPAVLPLGMEYEDYMKITLAMLQTADMVLLLDGWKDSDGAMLESQYAICVGIPCMEMLEFAANYLPEKKEPPKSKVERMFGPKENWNKESQPKPKPEPEPKKPEGYKGFLIIRCQHCGTIKGFCGKVPITEYSCRECGEKTPLDRMIPAYINCEKCGGRFKYRTNIDTHEPIPFSCLSCQAPVDLQLNKKGSALLNLRSSQRG